ncbi:hypothetical protein DY000_02018771 [Brassica cretica]|uniref:RNase H type-1 domain-containing protein n=1 Tax=Brassica cretica TaxID=69181 RepID=A0ABQ7D0D9_BRACR|nr:hypothetical protein DY000_02018771 [Brassica cretica]
MLSHELVGPCIQTKRWLLFYIVGTLKMTRIGQHAWNGAGKVAGLGWIIVDQIRATSFSSFTRFLSSPLVAEGLGLVTEILTCRDFGHPRIRCESDSSQLIKAINSDCSFAKLYGIVADIDAIASSFEFISFGWISLERNSVADRLAKQGCLLSLP